MDTSFRSATYCTHTKTGRLGKTAGFRLGNVRKFFSIAITR